MVARRRWLLSAGLALLSVLVVFAFPSAASATSQLHKVLHVRLALLPLRKAQLGAPGASLSLAHDSGAVPNLPFGTVNPLLWTSSLETFLSLASSSLQRDGWVGGYTLDYGDAFSGCSCVTEIRTSVQRFKTAAGAKKLLTWFKEDSATALRPSPQLALAVDTRTSVNVPAVGTRRFAFVTKYTTVGAKPVRVVDERFTDGRYLLQVAVAGGTKSGGTALASKLVKKLDKRLHLARAGRLHASAAKLPTKLTAGPPSGGPDLSTLAFQPSDFRPAPTGTRGSYLLDPFALALSDYQVAYGPAGSYSSVDQEIQWYPSANEAAFRSAYDGALSAALWAPFSDAITYVDLDSIGQGDRATILELVLGNPVPGPDYLAVISLSAGQATDVVQVESPSEIQPSEVKALAQSTAARLDAGLTG